MPRGLGNGPLSLSRLSLLFSRDFGPEVEEGGEASKCCVGEPKRSLLLFGKGSATRNARLLGADQTERVQRESDRGSVSRTRHQHPRQLDMRGACL